MGSSYPYVVWATGIQATTGHSMQNRLSIELMFKEIIIMATATVTKGNKLAIQELARKTENMCAGFPFDTDRAEAIHCGKEGEEWPRRELDRWLSRAYRARA